LLRGVAVFIENVKEFSPLLGGFDPGYLHSPTEPSAHFLPSVQIALLRAVLAKFAPFRFAPLKSTSHKSARVKSARLKSAPRKLARLNLAPPKFAPLRSAHFIVWTS
jgi:hypothetical protein